MSIELVWPHSHGISYTISIKLRGGSRLSSIHSLVMHALTWWSCMALLDGPAWPYLMVMHGLTWWSCKALLGGHARPYLMVMQGLTWWSCMALLGGHAWPYLVVMQGLTWCLTWWSCIMASFQEPTVLLTVLQGKQTFCIVKLSYLHLNSINRCDMYLNGLHCKVQLLYVLTILKKCHYDITDNNYMMS